MLSYLVNSFLLNGSLASIDSPDDPVSLLLNGSFKCVGSLLVNDSFLMTGPLHFNDSFDEYGSLPGDDSF